MTAIHTLIGSIALCMRCGEQWDHSDSRRHYAKKLDGRNRNRQARWTLITGILGTLKQVEPDQQQVLTGPILDQVGPNTSEATQLAPLTSAQLEKLAQNPHMTIGADTMPACADQPSCLAPGSCRSVR